MSASLRNCIYEKAKGNPNLNFIDNRAIDILCYDPRYTFVEKLQTIATKFRKEMETGEVPTNYMRRYYDVYSLLADSKVQSFIGSEEYNQHKRNRFPKEDFAIPINKNQAMVLHLCNIDPTLLSKLDNLLIYNIDKAEADKSRPTYSISPLRKIQE